MREPRRQKPRTAQGGSLPGPRGGRPGRGRCTPLLPGWRPRVDLCPHTVSAVRCHLPRPLRGPRLQLVLAVPCLGSDSLASLHFQCPEQCLASDECARRLCQGIVCVDAQQGKGGSLATLRGLRLPTRLEKGTLFLLPHREAGAPGSGPDSELHGLLTRHEWHQKLQERGESAGLAAEQVRATWSPG